MDNKERLVSIRTVEHLGSLYWVTEVKQSKKRME